MTEDPPSGPAADPAGEESLLKMLREGLAEGVREALQRAEQLGQPVMADALQVGQGEGFRTLSVEVIPLPSDSDGGGGFIVLFDGRRRPAAPLPLASRVGGWLGSLTPAMGSAPVARDEEIARLTRELEATRLSLQAVSDQHEAVTEELRSAKEEAQSSHEEMQSVNEELETSKEELEATNEELATLNDELAQRNAELGRLMEDLRAARDYSESIIANARVPLLVLDSALVVKSANRAFYQRFQVDPAGTDGFRLDDLGNRQWDIPGLRTMLEEVMSRKLAVENYEVRHDFETIGHRVMLLNAGLLPQGEDSEPLITLSIEDITDRALAGETRARLAAIVESSEDAIIGKNLDGIITSWNRGAENLFGYTAEEIVGRPVAVLIPDDRQGEETRILSRLRGGDPVKHFETMRRRKDGRSIHLSLSTSPIVDGDGKLVGVSKIARDITARKEAEQALRESEARYRAIGESIDYGVWVCDAEGRNIYASESFLDLVGLTQEQCSDFGWSEVLHPDDAVRTVEAWKECVKTGGVWDIEHRFRGIDGNWHPVLARGVPVKNDRGEVISWAGINLDISRQKNAERALEESGRRFRMMANAISQLAWTARADGYLDWYNDRWYEYTGTTPEAMEGWGWQAVHDPAELPRVMEQWRAAISSGETFDMTFPLRGADGTYRLFLTRGIPIKNEDGEVTQWFGTNTDIDDLKRTEAALRKSEEFTRSIIESSPDCIKVLDLDGKLLSLETGLELLGIPDITPYLGTSWLEIWLREEDRAAARDTVAAARSGAEGHFVGFYRTQDGRDRWWSVAISPVFGPGEKPVRLLAVSRDVTAQRDMEQMLVARAEALAEADRAKDEFLAMLAHELRNPLASLHHAAEVLNARGSGEAQRDHARLVLARQIGNMSRMIDDLLDVSRITEGKIELNKIPVDLHFVLNSAANLARSAIAARGQTMTLTLPAGPVYLEADATRLEQVFGNLLTNACKYGGEGCHIELEAELAEREVVVTVRDDGEGIAPDLLPRIFELFVQSSRTLDRAHGGLGIGLTLVRRLVKLHGGSVEARSAGIGRGSEFIVRLPRVASTPHIPPPAASPAGGNHAFRMLIVDDNVDVAVSLAMLQELLGHTIRIAHTGPAGLAVAADFVPEVVLLDIGLPGMDGYEVARQLRRIPALEQVILFGMSGYGRPEDRARAMLAGFDEYFVKPVDLDELREAIHARGGP